MFSFNSVGRTQERKGESEGQEYSYCNVKNRNLNDLNGNIERLLLFFSHRKKCLRLTADPIGGSAQIFANTATN